VYFAGVAQLVEHLFCKQVVRGSSPRASSAVGPRMGSTGSHACGFRVLASFGLRSDAHARECVPLRSSSKPRQNAELRARVVGTRPVGTVAAVANARARETSESCPSGQREQAVNLPAYAYAGSNPALSTVSPGTKRSVVCSLRRVRHLAGVAQLVERQPSKLNVEGSSPFSRSHVFGSVGHLESTQAQTFGQTRVGSLAAGEAEARTGAERTPVREHRTAGEAKPAGKIPTRQFSRVDVSVTAHLAQMVEHVLGKDEVTSSILVVGSKP
jgi:hypothetical protein